MTIRKYLEIVRKRALLIALLGALGAAAGVSYCLVVPRTYNATLALYVSAQSQAGNATSAYQGGLLSEQRVSSYAELVTSRRVTEDVRQRLRLSRSADDIASQISVETAPETVLLTLRVEDADSGTAELIANATGSSFSDLVRELEQPTDRTQQPPVAVRVVQSAYVNSESTSARILYSAVLGLIVGLVAAMSVAVFQSVLDTRIKSVEGLREIVLKPNLGAILADREKAKNVYAVTKYPKSQFAEGLRILRTNLDFVRRHDSATVLTVTSAVEAEGKTTLCCQLAVTLRQAGNKVLVIDADMRRPKAHELVGIPNDVGLSNVLARRISPDHAMQRWSDDLLSFIPSGPVPPNPSELLSSPTMKQLVESTRNVFDYVLIDAPPLLPVTDAAVVASKTDGALLIVREGQTTAAQVRTALSRLEAVSVEVTGTIIAMANPDNTELIGAYSSYYNNDSLSDAGLQMSSIERRHNLMSRHAKGDNSTELVDRTDVLDPGRKTSGNGH